MERDILVRPTEMTRPVKEDHLQSCSRIFPLDQTEMVRFIWRSNWNFWNYGLNGKRPSIIETSLQITTLTLNLLIPLKLSTYLL